MNADTVVVVYWGGSEMVLVMAQPPGHGTVRVVAAVMVYVVALCTKVVGPGQTVVNADTVVVV